MDPDSLFFGRALRRLHWMIAVLSFSGASSAAVYGGWPWAAGFVLGAAASYLNFRWLTQLVNALGQAAQSKPPKKRVAVLLGLRYLLLGAAGYVILNFSALSLAAALFGLFVPVAAVILEILFELAYART
jgi:hypothetical protein